MSDERSSTSDLNYFYSKFELLLFKKFKTSIFLKLYTKNIANRRLERVMNARKYLKKPVSFLKKSQISKKKVDAL